MYYLAEVITNKLESILDSDIVEVKPVSGGDINEARLIRTAKGEAYFVKINDGKDSYAMLHTESLGLQLLKGQVSSKISVPEVHACEKAGDFSFLLLEFIPPSAPPPGFWSHFGSGLAELHRVKQDKFGLAFQNFIGRLAQSNDACPDWPQFYTEKRLLPQGKLAYQQQLLDLNDMQHLERLCQKLGDIYPKEPPALIHGDLWNGNYLVHPKGQAVLIDPSVSYSHREMDLAMSKLFGGFPEEFYAAYHQAFPIAPGWEERLEIGQLYYLLAHLNLFGHSYRPAVKRIIRPF